MKHLITSVTIGACLLLSSAGDVFAEPLGNPHGGPVMGSGGQLGTGGANVAGCGASQPSPPGQVTNTNSSPFPGSGPAPSPNYAGAGPNPNSMGKPSYGAGQGNGAGTPNANSQYDNACLRQAL